MIKYIFFALFIFSNAFLAQSNSILFTEAMNEFNQKNYSRAYEKFDKIISSSELKNKVFASSKYYKALCLVELNKIEPAVGEFEFLIKNFPLSNFREISLYKLGTIYYETGDYSRARRRLMELLIDYPSTEFKGSAFYWIGRAFTKDRMYADAEEFLLRAVTERRNNDFVDYSIYSIAELYEKLDDFTNAVTYYDELLAYYKDSPLAPTAQLRIGISYFKLGEYDAAVLELSDPLIKELPIEQQTEAKYVLANSFFKLKDYKNAEKLFNEILNYSPNDGSGSKVKYALAWVQFQMEEYEDAFNLFNRISKENADTLSSNSLYWSAECKRYSGEEILALNIYEDFLSSFPTHRLAPMAKYHMGIISYNRRKINLAERYLMETISSANNTARAKAFTMLGEISLDKGDYRSALNFFREVMGVSGLNEDVSNRAILGMGIAHFYLKEFDKARMNLTDLSSRAFRFEKDKVNFYLAETMFQEEDYFSAVKHFARVTTNDENIYRQALYGRAYSYYNMKDYANSAFYFREFITKFPTDAKYSDAKMRLGDSYYGTKNYQEASNIYNTVFKEDKRLLKNDFAIYQYSQSLYRAGNSEAAIQNLKELQWNFPRSKFADDAQYLIGWIHFQQNSFNLSIISFKNLISQYPQSPIVPVAYYSVGDAYYNIEQYDSSIVYYNYLIKNYPATRYVYDAVSGIHYCYLALGQPETSVTLINDFVASNPRSEYADNILFKKGEIYYSLLNYEVAKVAFKEFVATYPESELVPEAYYWIGKSSAGLGQIEESEYYFGYLVEKFPKSEFSESAVLELGEIYVRQNDFDSAIRLYKSAIDYLSGSKRIPEILFAKAIAELKGEMMTDAYSTFEEVITYYDQSIFAAKSKIELGILELAKSNFDNAQIFFKDLAESRLDDLGAQAEYYQGLVNFERGNIQDAITSFVRVRSVFPQYDLWYTKSLIGLGDCYAFNNDKKRAKEMYSAAIKRHSRDELGKEAREKLRKL